MELPAQDVSDEKARARKRKIADFFIEGGVVALILNESRREGNLLFNERRLRTVHPIDFDISPSSFFR